MLSHTAAVCLKTEHHKKVTIWVLHSPKNIVFLAFSLPYHRLLLCIVSVSLFLLCLFYYTFFFYTVNYELAERNALKWLSMRTSSCTLKFYMHFKIHICMYSLKKSKRKHMHSYFFYKNPVFTYYVKNSWLFLAPIVFIRCISAALYFS